ncbi:2-heptaprenyl-1,4-naphthoquinone methyltransferase [[Actinomadura] parvosata subsp. kistnae]|uniref:Methyltransferase domain-containing protein n=1 Tax=[Actinomadura] parvosata subsp. kistnae TaxID=1909395 RepID=A0A1V0AAH4_9ACTN|nr:class I SAM-dependent methyltransferase [Nonomuraea sp. ATCC 55076]AQZ67206.1 hypothetical protein BKM31_42285 [Nonomuraea sp. ATCC 55076]SPL94580.1 2-heptaprenyl-1,4-naphthoquinone methyltransferase [Actinomadura parvosata subsp. kistnae]
MTASYFDGRAGRYAGADWHVRYAERLVELAALPPGGHVLDAATGTGFAAVAAARAVGPAGRVVGVDVSAGMLAQAGRLGTGLPNVTYEQGDVLRLDRFGEGTFDAVICSAGMLYLSVEEALAAWRRVLKPGGLVGFSAMRAGFPVMARLFRARAAELGLDLRDPMEALGDERRCAAALARAGFTSVRTVPGEVVLPRSDDEQVWRIYSRSPHYPEVGTLGPEDLSALRARFLGDVRRLDGEASARAPVVYAFGHR